MAIFSFFHINASKNWDPTRNKNQSQGQGGGLGGLIKGKNCKQDPVYLPPPPSCLHQDIKKDQWKMEIGTGYLRLSQYDNFLFISAARLQFQQKLYPFNNQNTAPPPPPPTAGSYSVSQEQEGAIRIFFKGIIKEKK